MYQIKKKVKNLVRESLTKSGYLVSQGHYIDDQTMEGLYKRFPTESLEKKRFYNVGCAGKFRHKYWTNVDLIQDGYNLVNAGNVDIEYDMTENKPLPLESSSAEVIYTSHVIEHVFNANVRNFFKEAYRSLKPGGVLRVTCPDLDLAINAFQNNDNTFFKTANCQKKHIESSLVAFCSSIYIPGTKNSKTAEELKKMLKSAKDLACVVKEISELSHFEDHKKNPDNHVNWFNREKLEEFLREAGFTNIILSGRQQSVEPILRDFRYFDSTAPMASIYVDAVK